VLVAPSVRVAVCTNHPLLYRHCHRVSSARTPCCQPSKPRHQIESPKRGPKELVSQHRTGCRSRICLKQ
jgi:hypothetical protein